MARVRIENARLESWDDVSINLKEIGERQLAIEVIENTMNQQISDLKLSAAMAAKPHQDRIKVLEQEVKLFTEENRVEIKGKTKFLDFGKLGFRQSTKIVIKSIKGVLDALKGRGMTDCITVKEEVNKDRLREYPDDVIVSVGASKRIEDTFWYEVDKEKLRDAQ